MRTKSFLLTLSAFCSSVTAFGQNATVTTKSSPGLLQLAGSGIDGQILVSANDWWGVIRAAQDLAIDFGKVTGKNLTLGNWQGSVIPGIGNYSKRTENVRRDPDPQWDWWNGPPHPPHRGDGGPNGGSWSPRQAPPPSAPHNTTAGSPTSSKTTVYYTYQPTTNFVNYTLGPAENFTGPTLINNSTLKTVIIAGTIGKSDVINALLVAQKFSELQIRGKWESYITHVVDNPFPGIDRALVIAGSDMRGTIYGLYDVSEQIGVSPWWDFADVPIKKSAGVWALEGRKTQRSPSVKYRGFFINDEQPALTNWINDNYAPGPYGAGFNHYFHARVFELLLRLKANYFWPAEWSSMFNVDDIANQPLADAYGIVMGSSHTEPMMRASNEWPTFGTQYGGNGQWAYNSNNVSIEKFFRYGAQRAKPYAASSLFTMAMRGSGDTAIGLTDEQAIVVVENVVKAQIKILTEVFSGTNVTEIPQMWCLYKEVQGYYEQQGLTIPDHVTLLWADDNWGNIRRLPLANETGRSGGAGVYYHIDYVGDPRDYKWINTIQLEKTVEQMQLAYARSADRIWVLNVGDIKPLEIPISHFLDLAYDTPKWSYDSVPDWLSQWATLSFDAEHADGIVSVLERYGMYAARRKYELMDPSFYSVINYNEADAVLAQWQKLANDAQGIYDDLDEEYQAAFYEMILQPVLGGQVVYQIYINAAKNEQYVAQKRSSANDKAMDVLGYFKQDAKLTQRYHELLDGKWNHILDQTHLEYRGYWQQPMRNTAPPLAFVQKLETSIGGNLGVGVEGNNSTVSGDDVYHDNSKNTLVLPPMDPYGPKTRWIDIFSRGMDGCQWNVTPWTDYVRVSPVSGFTGGDNGTDTRVFVSIDWAKAPAAFNTTTINMNISSSCGKKWGSYNAPMVQVPVQNVAIPSDFVGFVESDKHISIEAEHTTRNTSINNISYSTLPSHGRTLSGVTLMPVLAPSQPAGTGPVLEYDIYTFTNVSKANVTLLISPSQNQNGALRPLKYGVAFDADIPQTIQFVGNYTGGGYPPGWLGAVADAIWGLSSSGNTTTTMHNLSKTGKHTLKVWAVEPGVVIQKIIVDLGGLRHSYLGPPESFRAGVDKVETYDGTNFAGIAVEDVI